MKHMGEIPESFPEPEAHPTKGAKGRRDPASGSTWATRVFHHGSGLHGHDHRQPPRNMAEKWTANGHATRALALEQAIPDGSGE